MDIELYSENERSIFITVYYLLSGGFLPVHIFFECLYDTLCVWKKMSLIFYSTIYQVTLECDSQLTPIKYKQIKTTGNNLVVNSVTGFIR